MCVANLAVQILLCPLVTLLMEYIFSPFLFSDIAFVEGVCMYVCCSVMCQFLTLKTDLQNVHYDERTLFQTSSSSSLQMVETSCQRLCSYGGKRDMKDDIDCFYCYILCL